MTFPTSVTPAIETNEVAPFRIAKAFMTFAAQVIADLGTLNAGLVASTAANVAAIAALPILIQAISRFLSRAGCQSGLSCSRVAACRWAAARW